MCRFTRFYYKSTINHNVHKMRIHYPALDGLRGLAIIGVILSHNFSWIPNFHYFQYGVDLFFVISGFLITEILLSSRNHKNYFYNFYMKRIFRIFPLYYFTLVLFILVIYLLPQFRPQYNYYISHISFLLFHFQNWLPIIHPPPQEAMILNHYWSLSIEEQFYLLSPFLIFLIPDFKKLCYVFITLILCAILYRLAIWALVQPGNTKYLLHHFTRIDGICAGSLIAVYRYSGQKKIKAIIDTCCKYFIIIYAILFAAIKILKWNIPHFNILGYTSISIIFAFITLKCLHNHSALYKIFNNKILSFFGRISYGLYLYHFPILLLSNIYLSRMGFQLSKITIINNLLFSLTTVALAIILSYFSFKYFELPILKKRESFIR